MKVQANTNPSASFDDPQPYRQRPKEQDGRVIEMIVEDGVVSVPASPPMLDYRKPDASGVIVEDRLPPSPIMVSARYKAAARLIR